MMKAYEEYKDTGLNWCAKVPTHWNIKRNKEILEERKEKSLTGDGQLLSLSQYRGITLYKDGEQEMGRAESLVGYNRVYERDIVMNIMLAWNGSTAMSELSGLISPAYSVYYTKNADTDEKYLHYLYKLPSVMKYFQDHSTGIIMSRLRLYPNIFLKLYSIFPPHEEQQQIVSYLDDKVAKINQLIETKQKEISVLEEYRQGIINKAVTKGLNPDVEMKDSGIEWIGKIPKHWKLVSLRRLYGSILGKMLQNEPKSQSDELKSYLCAKDIHFSGINTSDLKKMWFSKVERENYKINDGDLLVVEGGAGAGGCAIFCNDIECYVQNSVHIVRSKGESKNKFLRYWIEDLVKRNYIDFACNKATIPHFTKEKLLSMYIFDVPAKEQQKIILYLEKQTAKIEKGIVTLRRQISLLEEYRTRLISDVVTGQIDVRKE